MSVGPFRNVILQHMDLDSVQCLQLRYADLPLKADLERPGRSIKALYF